MMNKYSNASDFTSIFIPRVFANITKERITHIVENVVPLGGVERIDIVEIDEKTNRVWIHFTHWYDTEFVNEFKKLREQVTLQRNNDIRTPQKINRSNYGNLFNYIKIIYYFICIIRIVSINYSSF
jgi:hypothetical protein